MKTIHVCVMTFATINVKRTATEQEPCGMAMLVAVTTHSYSWMAMLGAGTSWTCAHSGGQTGPPRSSHGEGIDSPF